MSERNISNECFRSTGFSYTLSLINGKYKMTILYVLAEFGVVRFNEMKKYIDEISYKTLSSTLKELEADKNHLFLYWKQCAIGEKKTDCKKQTEI